MASHARSIRPLSEHLINQIAAGEVIERPMSVVKELVENGLDAGARRIDVELGDGGLDFIVVTDDGCGLAGDEIHPALRRHWTSKIAALDDLDDLHSLGFRGEALASIAAVSAVEITSRRREDAHGWRVTAQPGQEPSPPVPHQSNFGTRVQVSALFHNVPARRRFLKRARTEFLHVQHLLRQLAFARPQTAFSLTQSGSRQLRLPAAVAGVPSARWRNLFGGAFAEQATYVSVADGALKVSGWIAGPALASNQSDVQFLALNGRAIRDRQLAHAIRLAYGESLPTGKFPLYALAVEVAPAAVDVNVHPGKLEVRLQDVRAVHDLVFAAVRRALGGPAPGPAVPAPSAPFTQAPDYTVLPAPRAALAEPVRELGSALALIDDRFLLYQQDAGVYALDLRAAWTLILKSRMRMAPRERAATRALLLPSRLPHAAPWLGASGAELRTLGFAIDDLGAAGLVLRSLPTVLPEVDGDKLCAAMERECTQGSDVIESVARAAAQVLVLGTRGQPGRAMLETMLRAAVAAGVRLEQHAVAITAEQLRRMSGLES